MDIVGLHEFEPNLGAAVKAILNESGIDPLLRAGCHNHPFDYVGVDFVLGAATGTITDSVSFDIWDLRFMQNTLQITIAQKRLSQTHPQLAELHQSFYRIAARIRVMLAARRLGPDRREIFTASHLPGVLADGELLPCYNVGGLTPRGTTTGFHPDFRSDYISIEFDFGFQVDARVLNAVLVDGGPV